MLRSYYWILLAHWMVLSASYQSESITSEDNELLGLIDDHMYYDSDYWHCWLIFKYNSYMSSKAQNS